MADEEMDVPQRGYNTEDVRVMAEPPRRGRGRRWLWLTLLILFVGPAVVVGLWALIALNYSYSTGERVGYVQKFSKKGWVCKTWEGELAMTTVPGTAPQLFEFSVRDDSIAGAIEEIMRTREGRVSLTYQQHKGVPTDCFGETDYYVVQARPVGPNLTPGAPPPAPAPGTATAVPTAPAAPLPTR
jgi:hypothetical protein